MGQRCNMQDVCRQRRCACWNPCNNRMHLIATAQRAAGAGAGASAGSTRRIPQPSPAPSGSPASRGCTGGNPATAPPCRHGWTCAPPRSAPHPRCMRGWWWRGGPASSAAGRDGMASRTLPRHLGSSRRAAAGPAALAATSAHAQVRATRRHACGDAARRPVAAGWLAGPAGGRLQLGAAAPHLKHSRQRSKSLQTAHFMRSVDDRSL